MPVAVLAALALIAAVGGLVAYLVWGGLASSEPYRDALAAARASPAVERALGHPVDAGFLVDGHIEQSQTKGDASLRIPVSGPRGSGTLHVEAEKSIGRWIIVSLFLEMDGTGARIDLAR